MKKDRKANILYTKLVRSIILLILDVALFTASTYAWFTSSVTTDNNTVNAGIMTIDLVMDNQELQNFVSITDVDIFNEYCTDHNLNQYSRFVCDDSDAHYHQELYRTITNSDIPVVTINNIEPGQVYPVSFKVLNRGDLAATFTPYFEISSSMTGMETVNNMLDGSFLRALLDYAGGEDAVINNYGSVDLYLQTLGRPSTQELNAIKAKLETNVDSNNIYNGKKLEDIIKVYVGNKREDIVADNYIGTIKQIIDGDIDTYDGYVLPTRVVSKVVAHDPVEISAVAPCSVVLCDEEGVQIDVLPNVSDMDDFDLLFVMPESAGNEYEYASLKMKVGVTANQVEYEYDGLNYVLYDSKFDHGDANSIFSISNLDYNHSYRLHTLFKDHFIIDANYIYGDDYPIVSDVTPSTYTGYTYGSFDERDAFMSTIQLEYSHDGRTWEAINIDNNHADSLGYDVNNYITIDPGARIFIRNKDTSDYLALRSPNSLAMAVGSVDSYDAFNSLNFHLERDDGEGPGDGVAVSGNIMYLLDKEGKSSSISDSDSSYTFAGLFQDNDHITDASKLNLKSTTLSNACYLQMFANCPNLEYGPKLISEVLKPSCYQSMFFGCENLVQCPDLPATDLAKECYKQMFFGCSSLTSAPLLPARAMKEECYEYMFAKTNISFVSNLSSKSLEKACLRGMFEGCNELAISPLLPATTLADECYLGMFANCSNLQSCYPLDATRLAKACYKGMYYNCPLFNPTNVIELPAVKLAENCYEMMFMNCSTLANACSERGLPALALAQGCYDDMFNGCKAISVAPEIFANNSSTGGLQLGMRRMFKDCDNLYKISIHFIPDASNYQVIDDWIINAGQEYTGDDSKTIYIYATDPTHEYSYSMQYIDSGDDNWASCDWTVEFR